MKTMSHLHQPIRRKDSAHSSTGERQPRSKTEWRATLFTVLYLHCWFISSTVFFLGSLCILLSVCLFSFNRELYVGFIRVVDCA
jgi:hypothetical protein